MASHSPFADRIDILLVGGGLREFEVYGNWLARIYGDRARLLQYDPRCDGIERALEACTIVVVDLDAVDGDALTKSLGKGTCPVIFVAEPSAERHGDNGAADSVVLTKPLSRQRFKAGLDRLLAGLKRSDRREATYRSVDFDTLTTFSPSMKAVGALIDRVSKSEAPVFIVGEAGCGKSIHARAIHARSSRAGRPFVAVDCASHSPKRLREALFGVDDEAGPRRIGAFERANRGTIYLSRIETVDESTQAMLVRFFQSGTIVRERGNTPIAVDARIVSSSTRDIRQSNDLRHFRDDLLHRLFVLPVTIPALRNHPEAVMPLAETFLRTVDAGAGEGFQGFTPDAAQRLINYSWPGNARELEATVQQIVVLHDGPTVTTDMLPAALRDRPQPAQEEAGSEFVMPDPSSEAFEIAGTLREFERVADSIAPLWVQEQRIIETAIAACEGHVGRAAEALQISPSTIYRKIQSWQDRVNH